MRTLSYLASIAALLVIVSGTVAAEKWTAEQKELWAVEEKFWSLNKLTDIEEVLSYFHPRYMGWEYEQPVPGGKDQVRKWYSWWRKDHEVVIYEITPLAIEIHGNFAFVHYYYYMVTKDKKGDEKATGGRWTDIWMKEGGKWLCIGDHGGKTPEK